MLSMTILTSRRERHDVDVDRSTEVNDAGNAYSFSEGKDLTACGAEAPLPPRGLRDIPDETVKALVDCLVTFILLATATTAVIDIVQEPAGLCVTIVLSGK